MLYVLISIFFFLFGVVVTNIYKGIHSINRAPEKPVWQVWVTDSYGNDHRVLHEFRSSVQKHESHLGSYAVHEDFNVAKIAVLEYEKFGKMSPFLTIK